MLAISPQIVSDSTNRLVAHNIEFIPLAPYQIILENQKLSTFKNEDFKLKVRIEGEEIPNQMKVHFEGQEFLMSKNAKNQFSFIWSLDNSFYKLNSKKIKNLIINKIANILKITQGIKITNFQSYPINLNLMRKYHNENILILGEGLHTIHPVAGQGFNLVLRDIKKLKEILQYYLDLGISLKSSYALKDFHSQRKPENILFGIGIDATHKFFKKNRYLDPFKEIIIKNISKNNMLKKISKLISNQGLSI